MKKLLIAAALCAGIPALAQDATPPQDTQTQTQPGNKAADVKSDARQLGSDLNRAGLHVGQTAINGVQQTTRNLGLSPKDQSTFKSDKAFTVVGTIQKASPGRVTIARDGLPSASLDIRKPTQITLNGQPWEAKNLQEGTQVRAKFQLDGTDPVAVTIDAIQAPASPKAQP